MELPGGPKFVARGEAQAIGSAVSFGIRTDRARIGSEDAAMTGMNGVVSNVEYRGSSVKISVTGAGIDDFTVILTDAAFFANPVSTGDAIVLSWALEDVNLLGSAKD
jgi:putative spermidine/putrescine transport system ATP-binding protein